MGQLVESQDKGRDEGRMATPRFEEDKRLAPFLTSFFPELAGRGSGRSGVNAPAAAAAAAAAAGGGRGSSSSVAAGLYKTVRKGMGKQNRIQSHSTTAVGT